METVIFFAAAVLVSAILSASMQVMASRHRQAQVAESRLSPAVRGMRVTKGR